MTTHKEALKLALEALEKLTGAAEGFNVSGVYFNEELWARKCLDDAYDAMGFAQEALAQPEQEPVAIQYASRAERDLYEMEDEDDTTPPQRTWVGLTDDEVYKSYLVDTNMSKEKDWVLMFYEAIEAKLKEKNT